MTDLVTFGETMLRLSAPPGERLETAPRLDARIGGAESNVAVAAAQLGHDAAWLSKLPDDPFGRRVVRTLRAHGVRPGVAWTEDARLGTYYLERAGAPRGTTVHYDRAGAAIRSVTPADLPVAAVEDARAFHVSGITPALSDRARETTAALLDRAREAGTTTTFDVNHRAKLWDADAARSTIEALLPAVDVLVVAERDAVDVFETAADPVEIAHGLATAHDLRTVVVTRGERGALALHDGAVHEQPAFAADTGDAVGSGDAFVGGFLTARLEGESIPDALARGAAAAAVARTVEGDALVTTPAEVAAVVAEGGTDGLSR